MNINAFGISTLLVGLAVACSGSEPNSGTDQFGHGKEKEVGKTSAALVDIHPCSWAEMDQAQAHCDANHVYQTRSGPTGSCTITACNASSSMIYYSYNVQ